MTAIVHIMFHLFPVSAAANTQFGIAGVNSIQLGAKHIRLLSPTKQPKGERVTDMNLISAQSVSCSKTAGAKSI